MPREEAVRLLAGRSERDWQALNEFKVAMDAELNVADYPAVSMEYQRTYADKLFCMLFLAAVLPTCDAVNTLIGSSFLFSSTFEASV